MGASLDEPRARDARAQYLEELTRWTLGALDVVVAFGQLAGEAGLRQDRAAILRIARAHLARLLPFRVVGFLTVSGAEFVLADCEPAGQRRWIEAEVERLGTAGVFAWALRVRRAVTVPAAEAGHTVVLHALSGSAHTLGMLVGIGRADELDLTDAASNLLSLIVIQTAHAVESADLHQRLAAHQEGLEAAIAARTRALEAALREAREAYDELSRTQARLVQAEKMEAVGRLAGGVAHDFNNLLTVIRGRGDVVRARLPAESPLRHQIDLIRETADRAAQLTRQLLAFSRKQVLEPQVVELGALVAATGAMLRRLIGEHVELAITPPPGPARVLADPGQLEQVILNLAVNARDAMPGGGRLSIEMAVIDVDRAEARARAGARPGRWVRLTVRDTGLGIDGAARAHLFEPFFTTKAVGRGTGLGLATVYGIVEQSGGFITVDSVPGEGATFGVHLPEVAGEPVAPSADPTPADHGAGPPGAGTVLLVEDEADVRGLVGDVLGASGYTVLEATDGEDALGVAARAGPGIALLLTDVVMPRMGGPELAHRLRATRPDLPVLFVSGYTDDASVVEGAAAGRSAFLHKPFAPRALVEGVRRLLDRARPDLSAASPA